MEASSTIDTTATVSVIVPSKDRPDVVKRLIRSIHEQTYPIKEILVIDDGSFPPLKPAYGEIIYRNKSPLGAGMSRNLGAAKATSRYLLFLDDDTILHDPLFVQKCVDTLRKFPSVSVLALRQLLPDLTPWYIQASTHDENCFTSSFFGVGFMILRKTMIKVGGFSDLIKFPNYEEREMSLRLLDSGYEIAYFTNLNLIHAEDARNRNWEHRFYSLFRNACYTAILRYPFWAVFPGILSHLYHYGNADLRGDFTGVV